MAGASLPYVGNVAVVRSAAVLRPAFKGKQRGPSEVFPFA